MKCIMYKNNKIVVKKIYLFYKPTEEQVCEGIQITEAYVERKQFKIKIIGLCNSNLAKLLFFKTFLKYYIKI